MELNKLVTLTKQQAAAIERTAEEASAFFGKSDRSFFKDNVRRQQVLPLFEQVEMFTSLRPNDASRS